MNEDDDEKELSPEEKLAQMRAAVDQGIMGLREYSVVLAEFFKSLVSQGFTREEALAITVSWMTKA